MLLSTTWTLNGGKFSPLLFSGMIDECIKVSKEFGFQGVEMSVRSSDDTCLNEAVQKIKTHKMNVSAIGTGLAYLEDGLSFSNHNLEIRKEALKRFKGQIRVASLLNAPVILGLIHGNISMGDEFQLKEKEWIYEITRNAARYASGLGTNIIVEPINRYETNFINTVREALDFIEIVNEPNIRIMIDTFHMNIEESSLCDSIKECKNILLHVHMADSNRLVPGYGHIDFSIILASLREICYDHYYSLECLPKPDPITAAHDGIEYLNLIENSFARGIR